MYAPSAPRRSECYRCGESLSLDPFESPASVNLAPHAASRRSTPLLSLRSSPLAFLPLHQQQHNNTMATDTIKHSIVTLEHSAPPSSTPSSKASPAAIAQAWCDLAQSAFTSKSADKLVQLFRPNDGTWRDILLTDPSE